MDSLAARTAQVLDRSGITALLIDGAATWPRIDRNEIPRHSGAEVSLLIPADRFGSAERALGDAGYRRRHHRIRVSDAVHTVTAWREPDDDLMLNLCHGFVGVRDELRFWDIMWEEREYLELADGRVNVPSRPAIALLLALRAGACAGSDRSTDLLLAAGQSFDLPDWSAAAIMAVKMAAVPTFRAGIELLPHGRALCTVVLDSTSAAGLRLVRPDPGYTLGRWLDGAGPVARAADVHASLACSWAHMVLPLVRTRLADHPITEGVQIVAPPTVRGQARAAVAAALEARHATCIERSLILQRFDAASGRQRALIIGVTSPAAGFEAHAWLEGDAHPDRGLREVIRVAARWN